MHKGLYALGIGGLAIGITEFSMMGMLQDVANDLSISIPQAGHLITLYAVGVVVGAPLLILIAGKYPPKKLLIVLMGLFTFFNLISGIVPNYETFLVSRFFCGLPHGAYFGVGTIVATKIAAENKKAQAISIMFAGLTLANLIGVPFATYIGHHYSWRYTYLLTGIIGLLTIFSILRFIPILAPAQGTNLKMQLNYFLQPRSWLLIGLISIGTGGMFAWISYISPLMVNIGGFSQASIPNFMMLAGLGMFIGNMLGGKIADTITPSSATVVSFFAMAICLVLVYFSVNYQWSAIAMTFITGVVAFSIGSSIQIMLIQSANGAEMIAAAAGQASFNIGNSLGAFLGGLPILYGLGYRSPQLVGCALATIGVLLTIIYIKKYEQRSTK